MQLIKLHMFSVIVWKIQKRSKNKNYCHSIIQEYSTYV